MVIRRAVVEDVDMLARLIDGFAKGHPAEHFARSVERLRDAFFGAEPVGHVLLAVKGDTVIGFGAWRKAYDPYWSMFGGDGLGLYVSPAYRGLGIAACIVAAICSEIREGGGHFLQASYGPSLASLYERVGVGATERSCHVSALAFERLAAAAGGSAREIVRGLPDKALNYVAVDA